MIRTLLFSSLLALSIPMTSSAEDSDSMWGQGGFFGSDNNGQQASDHLHDEGSENVEESGDNTWAESWNDAVADEIDDSRDGSDDPYDW